MRSTALLTLLFAGLAFGQYVENGEEGDVESVSVVTEWPQNDHALAGAIVSMVYQGLDDGTCTVQLPGSVNLFHVMNGHIVPGGDSSPIEGRYQIAAPAAWEAINGTFNTLILFERDNIFNLSQIMFVCDPANVAEISVYSFPQNNLMGEASSNIYYRNGFHKGDVLTITLPAPVDRFNFTTMDSRYTVDASDSTYTLSGFVNDEGIDDMKEVHFSLNYQSTESDDYAVEDNWFSAAQISVSITSDE